MVVSAGLLKQRSPRKCEERELESSWGPGCKRPRRASQGFGAALTDLQNQQTWVRDNVNLFFMKIHLVPMEEETD